MVERKEIKMTQQQIMQTFAQENARLEEMNRRVNSTFMALQEINTAIVALDSLLNAKDKEKVLVPLGAGVFLNATTQDSKNVLFSMAGGILKKSKNEEIKIELEKRKTELESALDSARTQHSRLSQNINTLGNILKQGQAIARQRKARS